MVLKEQAQMGREGAKRGRIARWEPRDNGVGGVGGWFHGATLWSRSFEKTEDVVFGPCGIVNAIDMARAEAPRIGGGVSSSLRRQ